MTGKLSRLRLFFPPDHGDLLTGLLFLHAPWGWQDDGTEGGLRRLTVHFDRPEQSAGLQAVLHQACPALRMETDTVDNADWTSAWKKYFTPIDIAYDIYLPSLENLIPLRATVPSSDSLLGSSNTCASPSSVFFT